MLERLVLRKKLKMLLVNGAPFPYALGEHYVMEVDGVPGGTQQTCISCHSDHVTWLASSLLWHHVMGAGSGEISGLSNSPPRVSPSVPVT